MSTAPSQLRKAVQSVVAFALLGALVLGGTWLYASQQVPQQPLEFNHYVHVQQVGLSCLYCHSNAARGQSAGLPSVNRCIACHNQIEPKSPATQALREYADKGETIPWVPVAIQPDFVYFSHAPHVQKGISCQACHGEVGQQTVAQPIRQQNMGWCLSCHTNLPNLTPERLTKLQACETCHK